MIDDIVNAHEYANLTYDVLESLDKAGYKVVKKEETPKVGDSRLIFEPTGDDKWAWRIEEFIRHSNLEFWTQAYDKGDVLQTLIGSHRKRHRALWAGINALHRFRAQQMFIKANKERAERIGQIFS